jgi:hypothetical protein
MCLFWHVCQESDGLGLFLYSGQSALVRTYVRSWHTSIQKPPAFSHLTLSENQVAHKALHDLALPAFLTSSLRRTFAFAVGAASHGPFPAETPSLTSLFKNASPMTPYFSSLVYVPASNILHFFLSAAFLSPSSRTRAPWDVALWSMLYPRAWNRGWHTVVGFW